MGCALFWLIVNCPELLSEYGKTTSPEAGVPESVNRLDPVSAISMGLAGTGKYGSGVPVAELTWAFTTSESLPVDWSILNTVISPHWVTVGPRAAAHPVPCGAIASSTYKKLPCPSTTMRIGFEPWLKNFC